MSFPSKNEFHHFFEEQLEPEMEIFRQELKHIRKVAFIIFGWLAGFAVIGTLALWFFVFKNEDDPLLREVLPVLFGLAVILIPLGYYLWRKNQLRTKFKTIVINSILTFCAPEVKYNISGSVSTDDFMASRLFPSPDRYSGSDLFKGTYDKVKLRFSKVDAQERHTVRDSKGNTKTYYTTIFDGIFFIADFNKNFRTATFALPDLAEKMFGAMIGNFLQKANIFKQAPLTRMENPQFEKEFAVYADDPVEARYILTPNIMERMLNLNRQFKSRLYFAFLNSNIYLAIPGQAGMFTAPGKFNYDAAELLFDQLAAVFGIVNELQLNIRIWTKN